MTKEKFILELENLNIHLTNEQLEKLDQFYHLLIEWNQRLNLTRIIEEEDVYLKHFYDSLTIAKVVDLQKVKTLCDVGSGPGFPGIVLKIVFPHLNITLLDSLNKRVIYLNEVIKKLELKNIKAIHTRGEDYNETFDVVTARAVANIEKLLTYTMHLTNNNGIFVAMKGNIDEEFNSEVEQKISKKYRIKKIEKFSLPYENSRRSLIVIGRKNKNDKF